MLSRLLVHKVTLQSPGSTSVNRYGDTVPDWSDPVEVDDVGWLTATRTTEEGGSRDGICGSFTPVRFMRSSATSSGPARPTDFTIWSSGSGG